MRASSDSYIALPLLLMLAVKASISKREYPERLEGFSYTVSEYKTRQIVAQNLGLASLESECEIILVYICMKHIRVCLTMFGSLSHISEMHFCAVCVNQRRLSLISNFKFHLFNKMFKLCLIKV